ncbi:MAG: hypothetical protein Q8903_00275 [Bacteroidota bacterium]|nr:hypothetical protein [Bacteroidota bacterium]
MKRIQKKLKDQGLTHQIISIEMRDKLKISAKKRGMTLQSFTDTLLKYGLENSDKVLKSVYIS